VLATGGGRPKDLPRGYFLEPTIFCDVPNSIRIAQEEIFGPSSRSSRSRPGRGDPHRERLDLRPRRRDPLPRYGEGGRARQAHPHRRRVDQQRHQHARRPFGGFKESGIGREGGRYGLEEYTEIQQIVWKS
jgi:hypothetical protein